MTSSSTTLTSKSDNSDGGDGNSTSNSYLGIDVGTQGLTALLVDEDLQVVAKGEATYDCISDL